MISSPLGVRIGEGGDFQQNQGDVGAGQLSKCALVARALNPVQEGW